MCQGGGALGAEHINLMIRRKERTGGLGETPGWPAAAVYWLKTSSES